MPRLHDISESRGSSSGFLEMGRQSQKNKWNKTDTVDETIRSPVRHPAWNRITPTEKIITVRCSHNSTNGGYVPGQGGDTIFCLEFAVVEDIKNKSIVFGRFSARHPTAHISGCRFFSWDRIPGFIQPALTTDDNGNPMLQRFISKLFKKESA